MKGASPIAVAFGVCAQLSKIFGGFGDNVCAKDHFDAPCRLAVDRDFKVDTRVCLHFQFGLFVWSILPLGTRSFRRRLHAVDALESMLSKPLVRRPDYVPKKKKINKLSFVSIELLALLPSRCGRDRLTLMTFLGGGGWNGGERVGAVSTQRDSAKKKKNLAKQLGAVHVVERGTGVHSVLVLDKPKALVLI